MEPWWIDPLRNVVGGRDVVIAGAVPAAWIDHAAQLQAAGARSLLLAATDGRGAGDGPEIPTVVIEPPDGLSMLERLHHGLRLLHDPPPVLVDALDEFDPDGEAIVVGSFLNVSPDLAGRPFVVWRRPEWVALEDKTVVDEFWDRAGVDRLASAVVALDDAPQVAPSIDRGVGTVWAADARDGFHGGAAHTHWVPDPSAEDDVAERLRPVCDRVRVMPFVDGVSCSIHGIVLPDGEAVLRPVELVTLRRGRELVYSGCATYWDPPGEVREQMRDIARRVARQLAAEVGFRGTFTVDGVVDADGFWPTELNPRFGAGINVIARSNADLPVMLLNDLIVGGHPIGRTAAEFEAELVERADAPRGGGTWQLGVDVDHPVDRSVSFDTAGWRWTEPGADPDGRAVGGARVIKCEFAGPRIPVGPSVGPLAALFWDFADGVLGTNTGPLSAPPDRSRPG